MIGSHFVVAVRLQFSISPSSENSGLISFRIDWFDLFVVQGTLKSLLQHHSSEVSILRRSAFFTVQLSHPYMTTGKTIALTRRTRCKPLGRVLPGDLALGLTNRKQLRWCQFKLHGGVQRKKTGWGSSERLRNGIE